jgi:hypothetical protein
MEELVVIIWVVRSDSGNRFMVCGMLMFGGDDRGKSKFLEESKSVQACFTTFPPGTFNFSHFIKRLQL